MYIPRGAKSTKWTEINTRRGGGFSNFYYYNTILSVIDFWHLMRTNLTSSASHLPTRYSPMMFPSVMTFPVDGVHLNLDQATVCNKTICSVVLSGLKRNSTGSYRCEISGDAPEFHVVHETANMTVASECLEDRLANSDSEQEEKK